MSIAFKETEELNINEERIIELKPKIDALENKLIVSDRTASQTILKKRKNANRN